MNKLKYLSPTHSYFIFVITDMSLDHFLDKPILFPKTNAQQLYSWLGCKTLSHVYTLLINELSSSATTELLLL